MADLSIFSEQLDYSTASHLLNRCLFGATHSEVSAMVGKSVGDVLDLLLESQPEPAPPVVYKSETLGIGETWVDAEYDSTLNYKRKLSMRSWWFDQMIHQKMSLQEKMVLFWHNHFATEYTIIRRPKLMYRHNVLLRKHACGNFKTFVKEITIDPAMLMFLDGKDNKVGAANENYGRELLELFTIGKGPQIAPGNYTNYTEDDVQEAAKVLTGWRIDWDTSSAYFTQWRHDKTTKTFSSSFGNRSISDGGMEEYKTLVDLIFEQGATAEFIVRKLYRYFVNCNIDADIEIKIIQPLATLLRVNNYELKPVLKTLLSSEHFFSEQARGTMIKNPVELVVGTLRKLEIEFPTRDNTEDYYYFLNLMYTQCANQEMLMGDPPGVAGWPAYYQEPSYYKIWITAATLPNRAIVTNKLVQDNGFKRNGFSLQVDVLNFVKQFSDVFEPLVLINDLAALLLPYP